MFRSLYVGHAYLGHVMLYLGHGWLLTFAKCVQKECDRQARRILEEFKSRRRFDHVISKIQEGMSQKSVNSEKYVICY